MITEEEKQEIIDKAVEKALLLLPETVGNLMTQQASMTKMNREFYSKYPEFKDHKDSVASVVEMIDGKSPSKEYKEILSEAVPEIRKRINTIKNLNVTEITSSSDRRYGEI